MGPVAAVAAKEIAEARLVPPTPLPGISEAEVASRVNHAVNEAEQRWSAEADRLALERDARLAVVIEAFSVERSRYFRQVETDVVQLALAVSRKILQREAALDPTLLRGLVRIALDRVGAEDQVRVRLAPEELHTWLGKDKEGSAAYRYELIADPTLSPGDCIIETDRGITNCGIDEQLKGIEQSFSDLLARRPETPR